MKKLLSSIWDNILLIETLFLLIFIPLYPKLPLLDVTNTWVYIRAEDFVVFAVLLSWVTLLLKRKITLKTPLTIPIMAFWTIGAIATIHGIVIIFPTLPNVFPNVAFLSYLRHVEYMSLFFIGYSAIREKKSLPVVISVLTLTLLAVVFYGVGQRYLGFPAYLTMNEEFAKGIPIQLSQLSRVPSTFAGHYDLAAYLVLIIPILASMIFGFRNWFVKLFLAGSIVLGFGLMFMTVSRVSFFVLFISLFIVLFFQKKKVFLVAVPLIAVFTFLFLTLQPTLLARFGNTVNEVDVIVDAETGESVGHVRFVPPEYFKDKILKQLRVKDKEQLTLAIAGRNEELAGATLSARVPLLEELPPEVPLVVATNVSTGETLPQGTGYINLSLSPVTKRLGNFFYEFAPDTATTTSAEVLMLHGNFLVKRASAYDLSFTTRFQGEWPRALEAFEKNIALGSGYGSVSLAVDNNYFRILGEIGLLGFTSFFAIFLALGIYIKKILPNIDSPVAKSFVLGFAAGVVGLALNATLIDVFEASKIAFLLWLLTGVVLGFITLYQDKHIDLYRELIKAATSPIAVIVYLLGASIVIFSPMLSNYFTADDFTWFRWAADCQNTCSNMLATISNYFTHSDGFFYRPGTKTYFLLMYSVFWLNQVVYHMASIVLHFGVAVLFYLLARRILKNNLQAAGAVFLFLIMSGYAEVVFWISGTGHLFSALFGLLALLSYIWWEDKKNILYLILSVLSIGFGVLFHEIGVVVPLLIIAYKAIYDSSFEIRKLFMKMSTISLFVPVLFYLIMRFIANSHWSGGDYSYNLIKLPFNIAGNLAGYSLITLTGPISLPFYESLRNVMKGNFAVAIIAVLILSATAYLLYKTFYKKLNLPDKRIILFTLSFFIISLLPFIGLGNIASRYSYLASLGLIILGVFLVAKLHEYLKAYGKDVATATIVVLISVFSLFHIMQVQQIHGDWHTAGGKVQKFLISLDGLYDNSWSTEPLELHFVNVPLKTGDAWVFPVGMEDAIWFTFQNDDLKIYKHGSSVDALRVVDATSSVKRIFEFEGDGSLKEVIINPKENIIQVN